MNNKKYEILMDKKNTIEWKGHTLHRIKALRDFGDIKKGDIGGFVENENNLSHKGNCWIYDDAKVMDDSIMYDYSRICDKSELHDDSRMYNYSKMYDYSELHNNSIMNDDSAMYDNSTMHDYSIMYDNSEMYNNSTLKNKTRLYGKLVSSVDNFIEIQNPQGRLVTCVRKGDKVLYNVGCQGEIDEETFIYRIEHENYGLKQNPHRIYYYKIIEMAKLYFGVK